MSSRGSVSSAAATGEEPSSPRHCQLHRRRHHWICVNPSSSLSPSMLATGILEVAADWDEDWDKLEDKGLRDKKCVPCNLKELQPMTKDAAHTLMPQVSEWNLVKEDGIFKLKRTWKVKTFTKSLKFFKIVKNITR
ncbi:hypothetical protein Ahy_A04g019347 [Arachis hypogaea]|uniref:4a-hydroxytetrahydrobiopterin dehydratase n=1 Tax=Arachis hypogaea TaxID=3818 RepID=A0A445DFT5_ARAHY|nr:hypothetical protein Ahy_A04g019347 [Arachis hypogaea]